MSGKHLRLSSPRGARRRLDVVLAAAAFAVAAGALAGFAWTRPERTGASVTYTQAGQLRYSAPAGAGSIYGRGGVVTGEPVYANAVHSLSVAFTYSFGSSVPADISGTERLDATISDGQGITKSIPIEAQTSFSGDRFVARGTLNMARLERAATALRDGAPVQGPDNYPVEIVPTVSVHGRVATAPLVAGFDQPVSFDYTTGFASVGAELVPSSSGQVPFALGAPTKTAEAQAGAPLTVSTSGSLLVPNRRSALLLSRISVKDARWVSLGVLLAALAITLFVGSTLIKDVNSDDERVRIATRFGSSLIDVDDLPQPPAVVVVELSAFGELWKVARQLECPVLRRCGRIDAYAVVDAGTVYRYSAAPTRRGTTVTRHGHNGSSPTFAKENESVIGPAIRIP